MGALIGLRALRCQRCLGRFTAFAPGLREVEPGPRTTALAVLPQPARAVVVAPPASARPLDEIQVIESEWRSQIQPRGLIEETLCSQLAHATWHLRSLQRAEREAITASVRQGGFNGESAMSLMHWRLSAERTVNSALAQLESYRQMQKGELPAASPSGQDLMALHHSLSRNAAAGISSHAMA